MKRVKEILDRDGEETFKMEVYAPDIDPTKAMEIVYEVKGKQNPQLVLLHMGELTMTGTADEKGNVNHIVMPMGGLELVMKLAYCKGEL